MSFELIDVEEHSTSGPYSNSTCPLPSSAELAMCLNSIFQRLILARVEASPEFITYAARIADLLEGGVVRYILVFVPRGCDPSKYKTKFSELNWSNVQTRKLYRDKYKLPPQQWRMPSRVRDMYIQASERVKTAKNTFTKYIPERPDISFEIVLLHDKTKQTLFQYNNRLTLTGALETFACSISRLM